MLFVHIGKRSNWHKGKTLRSSRSQIFFKIDVLKNLAIFTRKHLCWSLFLIKLLAWRSAFLLKKTPTPVFFCEYCEIIEGSFFTEHLLLIVLFRDFYVMIEFFGRLWVQNWNFSYFLCHCFVFSHNSSVRIENPCLFCTCIYTKIFSKYNFRTHYNVGIRNNIQYYSDFSQ